MLYVTAKEPEGLIKDVSSYFNAHKKREWFDDDLVKKIIKDINKVTVIDGEHMESPIFGAISPDKLSGGCKAVILMYVQDRPVYGTKCGDNCSKSILEVAKVKDVTIYLKHCPMEWGTDFDITFLDTGRVVHCEKDFVYEYYTCKRMAEGVTLGYKIVNEKYNELEGYLYYDVESKTFSMTLLEDYTGKHPDIFFSIMNERGITDVPEEYINVWLSSRIFPPDKKEKEAKMKALYIEWFKSDGITDPDEIERLLPTFNYDEEVKKMLKEMGLKEYNAHDILVYYEGRCDMDYSYIVPIK